MLDWVTRAVESMGYLGVALLMFLENVVPPLPSELIMPLAGYTAARGELSLWGVMVAGTVGSIVGQLPLYYAGRWLGRDRLVRWADRHGKWIGLSGADLNRATDWFARYGGMAVLLCRLVPGVRTLISVPAGVCGMALPRFLLYSTLGMGAWACALAYLGSVLGENYTAVKEYLGPVSWVVIGALVAAYIGWVIWRKRHPAKEPAEPAQSCGR